MHFQYQTTSPFNHSPFENLASTPQKRVKPNEDSTFENSNVKAGKLSLFQKMNDHSIGSRKEQRMTNGF
jgi:hypothetical protein